MDPHKSVRSVGQGGAGEMGISKKPIMESHLFTKVGQVLLARLCAAVRESGCSFAVLQWQAGGWGCHGGGFGHQKAGNCGYQHRNVLTLLGSGLQNLATIHCRG